MPRQVRQALVVLIETERLLLRPVEMADIDEFVALHDDPEVTRFIWRFDRSAAEQRLRQAELEWSERGHGMFAVLDRAGERFLGRAGGTGIERRLELRSRGAGPPAGEASGLGPPADRQEDRRTAEGRPSGARDRGRRGAGVGADDAPDCPSGERYLPSSGSCYDPSPPPAGDYGGLEEFCRDQPEETECGGPGDPTETRP